MRLDLTALMVLLLVGCEGVLSTALPPAGPTADPLEAPLQFSCDPAAAPLELPLPRLSRAQLTRTLRFAVERALPAQADAVWAAVQPALAQLPADQRVPAPGDLKGGYRRTDQSIQQSQIDAVYAVGVAIAQQLTSSSARLGALLGACASDADASNDRACLEGFLGRWAARVMRRPLAPEDVAFYADIAGSTPVDRAAVADVITAVLNAPEVLYRVEHGTDPVASPSPLTAHELAARLALGLWQQPPDDALWASAESGALLTPQGFDAELERLLKDDRLAAALDEFVDEWLQLGELPSLEALHGDPVFRAFAGTPLPTNAARAAMIEDVQGAARNAVVSGATLSDLLGDRRPYGADGYLASIYGSAPLARRAGLLTRPALLATGTASTRPIHKGYLVRNALLCQSVGAPPPNAGTTPPAPTQTETTRQSVARLTGGGTCGGCHTTLINPQGFVLEGFDALGRERDAETLYDPMGKVTASSPVDTTAEVMLHGTARRKLGSAAELTQAIDETRLFHSCFARHWFRFAHARVESPTRDGCLLSRMETAARTGTVAAVLETVARDTTFKSRRFE